MKSYQLYNNLNDSPEVLFSSSPNIEMVYAKLNQEDTYVNIIMRAKNYRTIACTYDNLKYYHNIEMVEFFESNNGNLSTSYYY